MGAGRWSGEPTEGALKVAAMKGGVSAAGSPRVGVVPFDSANKFMATLNEGADGSRAILVKGAPDRLLERAESQRGARARAPRHRRAGRRRSTTSARRACACSRRPARPVDAGTRRDRASTTSTGLEFLGLWGILDPPRPEAIEAIADCHPAGIRRQDDHRRSRRHGTGDQPRDGPGQRRRRRACSPAPSSRR